MHTDIPETILIAAQQWATAEFFDNKTRQEISILLEKKNNAELIDRFYRGLEFGTGGLRGVMGAGLNRMNTYNVMRASYALGKYLHDIYAKEPSISVAIAYDSRNFSKEFAWVAAQTLADLGIKSLITDRLTPVPLLSYLVRFAKCHAGICVTASHNPPEYNGYKVYWRDGGQLVPPHDKNIIALYNKFQDYSVFKSMDRQKALELGLIQTIGDELYADYTENLSKLSLNPEPRKDFSIVYSPLHGSGLEPMLKALKAFGFKKVAVVSEQEKPDGNFPTVSSPNPEDKDAMGLAIAKGKELQADLIMATDPDADRIGVVIKSKSGYINLNGNQFAALLTDYIAQHSNLGADANGVVIKTIVTTELVRDIAINYGLSCEDMLTGFKWIGERMSEYEEGLRKPYRKVLCGGEESYGFLVGRMVRDKDAINAGVMMAEMISYYKNKNMDVEDILDGLYRRHGYYFEDLQTITLKGKEGAEKITAIMTEFRQNPPHRIGGKTVTRILDYEKKQGYRIENSKPVDKTAIDLPASNVLQFFLEDNSKISVRPSGTEPKIKFYYSVHDKPSQEILSDPQKWQFFQKECRDRVINFKAAMAELLSL